MSMKKNRKKLVKKQKKYQKSKYFNKSKRNQKNKLVRNQKKYQNMKLAQNQKKNQNNQLSQFLVHKILRFLTKLKLKLTKNRYTKKKRTSSNKLLKQRKIKAHQLKSIKMWLNYFVNYLKIAVLIYLNCKKSLHIFTQKLTLTHRQWSLT